MDAAALNHKKGMSGSTLKLIAIITMFIDHFGAVLLENSSHQVLYFTCRFIGRIAFPIFCFLLVEGFGKTRCLWKYELRLFLFAFLSEIPFDLAIFGTIWYPKYQNVFFTMAIGLLTITAMERIAKRQQNRRTAQVLSVVIAAAGCVLAALLKTDYGAFGVLVIVIMYLTFADRKTMTWAAGAAFLIGELIPTVLLAFIPIHFYNGERGLKIKYFFYIFYPAHLLVLYMLSRAMGLIA